MTSHRTRQNEKRTFRNCIEGMRACLADYRATRDIHWLQRYNYWRYWAIEIIRRWETLAGVPHRPKRFLKLGKS